MSDHVAKFRAAYIEKLIGYIRKDPAEYAYLEDKAPIVVDKMIAAFQKGSANNGPASKAAARACGIKPTQAAIREYLNT
jgi:hypothetical protein